MIFLILAVEIQLYGDQIYKINKKLLICLNFMLEQNKS